MQLNLFYSPIFYFLLCKMLRRKTKYNCFNLRTLKNFKILHNASNCILSKTSFNLEVENKI